MPFSRITNPAGAGNILESRDKIRLEREKIFLEQASLLAHKKSLPRISGEGDPAPCEGASLAKAHPVRTCGTR